MGLGRSWRGIGAAALALALTAGLSGPSRANAAVSCSLADGTLAIHGDGEFEQGIVRRVGSEIAVFQSDVIRGSPQLRVSCAGNAPTVLNTASIIATNTGGYESNFIIDLSGGPFMADSPGSPEIQFTVRLPSYGINTALGVIGTDGPDYIRLGRTQGVAGIELNAGRSVKPDVAFTNAVVVFVQGGGGDDVISAHAGPGFDDVLRIYMNAFGDAGNDSLTGSSAQDALIGGPGRDRLTGLKGKDALFGDAGRDFLSAGPSNDYVRPGPGRDRVRCGAGVDSGRPDRNDRASKCEGLAFPKVHEPRD